MDAAYQDAFACWTKFLNPQSLKSNLITASIYLAAWETFKQGVIEHLKGFYFVGFEQDGDTFTNECKGDVLSRDKSPLRASLLWFQDRGAIEDSDLVLVDRVLRHRNDIAHNLPAFIATASHHVDLALFADLCTLLAKIDRWWIRNVVIPTNSEFDDQDVDAMPDSEIHSGNMVFLSTMLSIATGDEAAATRYFDQFVKTANDKLDSR